MDYRSLESPGDSHYLLVGAGAPRATKHRDARDPVQEVGDPIEFHVRGDDVGLPWRDESRRHGGCVPQRNVAWYHNDRYALAGNCGPDRSFENLCSLLGAGNEFHVVTAFLEQDFRMRGLEVVDPDLGARNMVCD